MYLIFDKKSNSLASENVRFRCTNKEYLASVIIDAAVKALLETNGQSNNHNPPIDHQVTVETIRVAIKRKAVRFTR